jgi:hypothetical protein
MLGYFGGGISPHKAATYTKNKYREKHTYTSMLLVGFESKISVFERVRSSIFRTITEIGLRNYI